MIDQDHTISFRNVGSRRICKEFPESGYLAINGLKKN